MSSSIVSPPLVVCVQRHDFGPHYSDEVACGTLYSIHTTKAAANLKAKVLVRGIHRNEDTNDVAKRETEQIDDNGIYFDRLVLNQDEVDDSVDHVEVTTSALEVRGDEMSPYPNEDEEDQFASSVEGGDKGNDTAKRTTKEQVNHSGQVSSGVGEESARKRGRV